MDNDAPVEHVVPLREGGTLAFRVGGGVFLPGTGGWAFWHLRDGLDVRVRIRDHGGELVPEAVLVRATSSSVTGTDLRSIPLGRLEAALRQPQIRQAIAATTADSKAPDLSPSGMSTDAARHEAMGATAPEPVLSAESLRIDIPKGKRGDDFYTQVGLVVSLAAVTSPRPLADVAEANGVPLTTVRRWIKERRRREQQAAERRRTQIADDERVRSGEMTEAEYTATWREAPDLADSEGDDEL